MNKNELVDAVTGSVGDRPTAAAAVDAVLATVVRTVLAGEKVALSGFGVFEKVDRAARTARNPATGAAVSLAATSVPRFRAGQAFKEVISGARDAPAAPPERTGPPPARRSPTAAAPAAPAPAAAPAAEPTPPPAPALVTNPVTSAAPTGRAAAPSPAEGKAPAGKKEKKTPAAKPKGKDAAKEAKKAGKDSKKSGSGKKSGKK